MNATMTESSSSIGHCLSALDDSMRIPGMERQGFLLKLIATLYACVVWLNAQYMLRGIRRYRDDEIIDRDGSLYRKTVGLEKIARTQLAQIPDSMRMTRWVFRRAWMKLGAVRIAIKRHDHTASWLNENHATDAKAAPIPHGIPLEQFIDEL